MVPSQSGSNGSVQILSFFLLSLSYSFCFRLKDLSADSMSDRSFSNIRMRAQQWTWLCHWTETARNWRLKALKPMISQYILKGYKSNNCCNHTELTGKQSYDKYQASCWWQNFRHVEIQFERYSVVSFYLWISRLNKYVFKCALFKAF